MTDMKTKLQRYFYEESKAPYKYLEEVFIIISDIIEALYQQNFKPNKSVSLAKRIGIRKKKYKSIFKQFNSVYTYEIIRSKKLYKKYGVRVILFNKQEQTINNKRFVVAFWHKTKSGKQYVVIPIIGQSSFKSKRTMIHYLDLANDAEAFNLMVHEITHLIQNNSSFKKRLEKSVKNYYNWSWEYEARFNQITFYVLINSWWIQNSKTEEKTDYLKESLNKNDYKMFSNLFDTYAKKFDMDKLNVHNKLRYKVNKRLLFKDLRKNKNNIHKEFNNMLDKYISKFDKNMSESEWDEIIDSIINDLDKYNDKINRIINQFKEKD